jgi:hypothetical protein
MMKTCNETVYDSDAPPPAAPKSKRVRTKKITATTTVSTEQSQIEGVTYIIVATPSLTNSPATNTGR